MSAKSAEILKLMFWNIKGNEDTYPLIASYITQFDVDMCVLAEMPYGTTYRLQAKLPSGYTFQELPSDKAKIKYIYNQRIESKFIDDAPQGRGSMLSLKLNNGTQINLVGCHLLDSINHGASERCHFAQLFSAFISGHEAELNNDMTIVIGDFNMNPFEEGMAAAYAFNAVMDKSIAKRKPRKYKGKAYPYFFNPMWHFYGHPIHANGTIYYNSSNKGTLYYWNLYDQILLRASLCSSFRYDDIGIVKQIDKTNLLTNRGGINKDISDHLPIYINLKI